MLRRMPVGNSHSVGRCWSVSFTEPQASEPFGALEEGCRRPLRVAGNGLDFTVERPFVN